MGRPVKKIQYMSSDPDAKTGILFVPYWEKGFLKRKSWSWHFNGKRTHDEAYALAEAFIAAKGL